MPHRKRRWDSLPPVGAIAPLPVAAAFASALLAAPVALAAQQRPDAASIRDFDRYVSRAVRQWNVPGLAVAIVHDDDVVFTKGYGTRTVGRNEPVDSNTLFANASTTKAFTAMAVAILVERGKLAWDDPVARHVPEYALGDPDASQQQTVRDLLSHRTGFGDPGYLWYGIPNGFDSILTRLRHVEPAERWMPQYAYNNVTYAAAGEVAARVSGLTWDDLVRRDIFEPLGMHRTFTRTRDAARDDNVATPHDVIDGEVRPIVRYDTDNIGPAGSMYSSVADMTRWIRVLLDSGRTATGRLVSQETFATLITPHTLISPDQFYPTASRTWPHFTAYGLGWFLQDYRGELAAFHTGSIDGMVAIVGLLPDHKTGVVVFANRDHAELRHALMFCAFDMVLGPPQRDWSAELKQLYDSLEAERDKRRAERDGNRVTGTSPSLPLDGYVGTYVDDLYGPVDVRLENGRLVAERSPFLVADLEHWHFDTFRAVWRHRWVGDDLVSFLLGNDGRVAQLEIDGQVRKRK